MCVRRSDIQIFCYLYIFFSVVTSANNYFYCPPRHLHTVYKISATIKFFFFFSASPTCLYVFPCKSCVWSAYLIILCCSFDNTSNEKYYCKMHSISLTVYCIYLRVHIYKKKVLLSDCTSYYCSHVCESVNDFIIMFTTLLTLIRIEFQQNGLGCHLNYYIIYMYTQ